MQYYESVPDPLRGELSIPSKWQPGMACPNCAAEGRPGILMLLDKGDDLPHRTRVSDWHGDGPERFELVCSEWVEDYCTFHPYSLGGVSATVAENWDKPY